LQEIEPSSKRKRRIPGIDFYVPIAVDRFGKRKGCRGGKV